MDIYPLIYNCIGINMCPANTVRWCVISDEELAKCRAMSAAFKGEGLTPEISCFRDVDHAACMKSIAGKKKCSMYTPTAELYYIENPIKIKHTVPEI